NPGQARAETVAALAELAKAEPDSRDLYLARQRAIEALALPGAAAAASGGAETSTANVEQQALQALEAGDASALQGLAEAMVGRRAAAPAGGGEATTGAHGAITVPPILGEPLPEACAAPAKELGLERVELTVASPGVSSAVADFMERYAL